MPFKGEQKRVYERERYQRNRREWFEGKFCVDCGSTTDLQIDHRDRDKKVTHWVFGWTKEKRLVELAKCDARCPACHTERHAIEMRKHGITRYERGGCRCEICRVAKAHKNQRYRKNRELRES